MTEYIFGGMTVRTPRKDYEADMREALASAGGLMTLTPNAALLAIAPNAVTLKGAQITAMREHDPEARESENNQWTIEAGGQSFVVPCAFIWRVGPKVGGWLVYKPTSTTNVLADDGAGFVTEANAAARYDITKESQ